jgi:hypothetical protein
MLLRALGYVIAFENSMAFRTISSNAALRALILYDFVAG